MFCVLDIESSGGPFGKEAIIEIALYRYDGDEVVDQLISLVHPHREVQNFVTRMTGITEKMLARAPRFHEIAKRIIEITEDAILVGHNVEFDYRMLRQEFARLGYPYERETLDTIDTARELIPGLPAYGLDKICKELGIYMPEKHRADADARATLELFKILREKDQKKEISVLGQSVIQGDHKRDKFNDLLRTVKISQGLFYLHDREGKLLYLGASDNIKAALNRIFVADSKKAHELGEKVFSVKAEAVGNWLVARIKKMEELRQAKPPYNRQSELRLERAIIVDERPKTPRLQQVELKTLGRKKPLVKGPNQKTTARALSMFSRAYRTDESKHEVLALLKNFPSEAVFQGAGRTKTERCALVVENHQLVGYYYFSLSDQVSQKERLAKNMTTFAPQAGYTEMLKLGILSGEFRVVKV
jgi:DNA polymerase-3 subunit epsilon